MAGPGLLAAALTPEGATIASLVVGIISGVMTAKGNKDSGKTAEQIKKLVELIAQSKKMQDNPTIIRMAKIYETSNRNVLSLLKLAKYSSIDTNSFKHGLQHFAIHLPKAFEADSQVNKALTKLKINIDSLSKQNSFDQLLTILDAFSKLPTEKDRLLYAKILFNDADFAELGSYSRSDFNTIQKYTPKEPIDEAHTQVVQKISSGLFSKEQYESTQTDEAKHMRLQILAKAVAERAFNPNSKLTKEYDKIERFYRAIDELNQISRQDALNKEEYSPEFKKAVSSLGSIVNKLVLSFNYNSKKNILGVQQQSVSQTTNVVNNLNEIDGQQPIDDQKLGHSELSGSLSRQRNEFEYHNRWVKRWSDACTDSLVNFAKTGKFAIKDMTDSIIEDFIRLEVQRNITSFFQMIFGVTSDPKDGLDNDGDGRVDNKKGIATNFLVSESPLVTQNGSTNVQIIDQRSSGEQPSVKSETLPDGSKLISVLVRDEVKSAMADGSMDSLMSSQYGLKRRGARR